MTTTTPSYTSHIGENLQLSTTAIGNSGPPDPSGGLDMDWTGSVEVYVMIAGHVLASPHPGTQLVVRVYRQISADTGSAPTYTMTIAIASSGDFMLHFRDDHQPVGDTPIPTGKWIWTFQSTDTTTGNVQAGGFYDTLDGYQTR